MKVRPFFIGTAVTGMVALPTSGASAGGALALAEGAAEAEAEGDAVGAVEEIDADGDATSARAEVASVAQGGAAEGAPQAALASVKASVTTRRSGAFITD
ncbi:MAG: hypothetical protein U0235_33155 [Polyangiaceae bacterium]